MPHGFKAGGRQKGTPNKRTVDLAARLKALKCDPVGELVHLAQAVDIDPAIRARCYIELLAYLYPKRKAIEITAEIEHPAPKPDLSIYADDELDQLQVIVDAAEARKRNGVASRH